MSMDCTLPMSLISFSAPLHLVHCPSASPSSCCWSDLPGYFLPPESLHLLFFCLEFFFPFKVWLISSFHSTLLRLLYLKIVSLVTCDLTSLQLFFFQRTYLYLNHVICLRALLSPNQIQDNVSATMMETCVVFFATESSEPGICPACGWNSDTCWMNECKN
jgi:hypothetical protein